ncbi:general transcription factor II-I repeat domain-containing protein 2A-like [Centruroides vittatus]|uniref:general transcription factor II-I repeat domain-containing protein 2A-like n=1 Tax=Centruroides vittatus TaxID=120091 RepID=UPI00350F86BA
MYGAFEKTLEKNELSLLKLSGITTDGAQSFRGERRGLIGILSNKLAQNENPNDLFICHCVLHVENLCAKKINMEHVMDIVVSTVNFLRGRALNHRQFKEFLSDIDAENNDVVYFTDVRWLSKSSVLQRFYNLLPEIKLFMEMKGKPVKELSDCEWLTDLAFFVDITMHLSELNIKMQGKNLIISEFITFIKAFISKLKLWSTQLRNKNCHFFPTLLQRTEPKNYFKYAEKVEELEQEFKNRFEKFLSRENEIRIITAPFSVNIENVPNELQLELIDLQSNLDLKDTFKEKNLVDFYKTFIKENQFPNLRKYAAKILSLFCTIYVCE